jgi:hypothetical protein
MNMMRRELVLQDDYEYEYEYEYVLIIRVGLCVRYLAGMKEK